MSGAQLVIIPAGVPRKPGMTRDDLFNINASIVKTLVEATAKAAPDVSYYRGPFLQLSRFWSETLNATECLGV